MWGRLFALTAALTLTACGPSNPGPSGQLASVLDFGAYPRGTLTAEWYSSNGGPMPMPGNWGWREYRTDDGPQAIRAHYEQLARTHGWGLTPASAPPDLGITNNHVGDLVYKTRTLRIQLSNTPGGAAGSSMWGPAPAYPKVEPSPEPPSTPPPTGASPGVAPTPQPTPTLPPGPWYVRTDGQVSP